jgi:serine/threonine-protein kinase
MLIRRRVAIKQLHAKLASDPVMLHRFLSEAAATGTIGHCHVIESTDMGFTRDGVPFIVFEYLEGCLLSEEIHRLGRLPIRRAVVIARQIASALEAVHGAQIAHLDLKSDNVFLIQRGHALDHAKLIDFGISRSLVSGAEPPQRGVLMGTPEFMAPEQITSPESIDSRADIYALGVVLYEMLAGHCPFDDDNVQQVLQRVIHDPPPRLDRALPAALECLLFDGLLAKSPAQRIQRMTDVTAMLDAQIAAMRSGVPRARETFDDGTADLATAPAPRVWPVGSIRQLDAPISIDAPSWEVEVWP